MLQMQLIAYAEDKIDLDYRMMSLVNTYLK